MPAAISRARFGPDRAAMGRPAASSATTWLIRRWVPSSIPLTTDRIGTPGARDGARRRIVARTWEDGTASRYSRCGSASSVSSSTTRTFGGNVTPGRYRSFVRSCARRSAPSFECDHRLTGRCASARCTASVVPQAPAPMTPT